MPADTRLRVAVDVTSLLGTRTGVGHVTAQLIGALASADDVDVVAYAVTWKGRRSLATSLPPGVRAATAPIPARLTRALWPRVAAPHVERWTGPVDVVHATNFVAPPARAPVLVTVHDLTFSRFPEMCTADTLSYPRLLRVALDRGATVHTFSEFVAAEVRDEFGLPVERVICIPPGLAPTTGGDARRGRALAGAERYVVAIGTIEPRKNLPNLVRAFDRVARDDPHLALVVAGPDGWGADELTAALGKITRRERVHRLGYVGDEDRRDLLAGATALAYPSVYEGFGHPPLEAMQAGIPVVAGRAGALPEVLGDAALLVDPGDVDAISDALRRAVTDDVLRADLVGRGHEQAARYRWDTAAAELVALYRRLARV